MADSEWFTVEFDNGASVPTGSGHWPNRETADALAAEAAEGTDRPVFVVRCTREVVATATRSVTVTTKDLATGQTSSTSATSSDVV